MCVCVFVGRGDGLAVRKTIIIMFYEYSNIILLIIGGLGDLERGGEKMKSKIL